MELQGLLAPVAGEFDADEALASWRWLVPENVRPLVLTAFGDLFLISNTGAVLFLDTAAGKCSEVASSIEDWEGKLRDDRLINEWFMPGLLSELLEAGLSLCQGECYSAMQPIILNGEFSAANWRPTHWRVHFHSLGQIHDQVKDLPEGTKITKINYTEI